MKQKNAQSFWQTALKEHLTKEDLTKAIMPEEILTADLEYAQSQLHKLKRSRANRQKKIIDFIEGMLDESENADLKSDLDNLKF